MAPGPQHGISNLELSPGELSFDATIEGVKRRIWFRTETEVEPYPEAALAAALMPAMRSGGTLTMNEPISPRVLRTQREFQGIQRAWSLEWGFGDPPLCEVEVEAPRREPESRSPTGRVAAFFSGGVDSWSTVLSEPELTDLIFVRGVDILAAAQHQEGLADQVEERLREAAAELGLTLHSVETNLRELSDPLVRWESYYGCAIAAVALFCGSAFDRVLIAGDADYEMQVKLGANWMVDQLWSTENLEIVDDGGRYSRLQRVARIARHPAVHKSLRVCWQNPDGAYNCGHCRKCVLTMVALEVVDGLEAVETLPSEIDLEALAALEITQPVSLTPWEDLRAAARVAGKTDLELALGAAIDGSKRALGLPSGYRRRHGPIRPGEPEAAGGILLATPATAQALADAGAAALLVGSYDGSGNFGDIAQLDGALRLLENLGLGLLKLPVVERQYAQTHRATAQGLFHQPTHALYFDDGGGSFEDDLAPLPPVELGFTLSYLYGGGFLNPTWGERKLAMLRAVEQLAQGAGNITRIASGQQVDASWIAELQAGDARLLAAFELLGARDDASAQALQKLRSAGVAENMGDDAVGVLAGVEGDDAPPEDVVNVHIAAHEWVTGDPDAVHDFYVGLLAELMRVAGRPLRVRPLLAYLDPRVDERPALERFTSACTEQGVEVEEARVLRPATIDGEAPRLRRALLTISCSYHVALTSLLLGVPAVILRDNRYYGQKARGLLADFGLPAEFSPSSQDDPARSAKRIASAVFEDGEETRSQLRDAAAKVRQRRVDAETTVLRQVARGAIAAAGKDRPPEPAHPRPLEQRALAEAERQATAAGTPSHKIADLTLKPGELSFEARFDGLEPQRIWIRTSSEVEPNADPVLPLCLLPAMRGGGELLMDGRVSPRVLRNQREFQAIQRSWSFGWHFGEPPLEEVEVLAPTREPERPAPSGRVAAFFSGGVDSFSTILANPDVTDLIFVRGIDLLPRLSHQGDLADRVEERLREAAAELGLPLHVVETNARELSEPLVRWEAYCACPLAAVALFFAPLFDRVLIAGDTDHETQPPLGPSRLVDQLWSTESLEIVDDGGRFGRDERLARIAAHPVVRRTLRVCWENPEGAYNCGRCRKCMLTKISLEAIGAREEVTTFPPEFDLGLLETFEISQPISLILWEDLLDTVRHHGREDLERAVAPLVARGKRALGLSQDYRLRLSRGGTGPTGPTLELEQAQQQLETVLGSRSWRMTEPARRLATRLRARLRS